MLIGENSTVYIARGALLGGGYAALSLDTGSIVWQKTGAVNLTAALKDGSVLVNGNTVTQVEIAGGISDFVGGATLRTASYAGDDRWVGTNSSGGVSSIAGMPAGSGTIESGSAAAPSEGTQQPATTPWEPASVIGSISRGNNQRQNAPPTLNIGLIWCANSYCLNFADPDLDVSFNYWKVDQLQNRQVVPFSTAQKNLIKLNTANSLRLAFARYFVRVVEGVRTQYTVYISGSYPSMDPNAMTVPCASTNPYLYLGDKRFSRVFFYPHMEQAQYAVGAQPIEPTDDIAIATGMGMGNNAAHEVAHQLKVGGLHDGSLNTYNGAECNGTTNPWVYTSYGPDQVPIHWGATSDQNLKRLLGEK